MACMVLISVSVINFTVHKKEHEKIHTTNTTKNKCKFCPFEKNDESKKKIPVEFVKPSFRSCL